METLSILLWGAVSLAVVIVLGIIFSKRNSSKKKETEHIIEVPEKEYSQYNEEEDAKWADEPETPLKQKDEEDDRDDYSFSGSGIRLTDLFIEIVVLGIVLTIGMTILGKVSDSMNSGAISNSTTFAMKSFSVFGDWFAITIIVGVAGVILATVFRVFNWTRVGDL